jgi:hypothetical protein
MSENVFDLIFFIESSVEEEEEEDFLNTHKKSELCHILK